MAQYLLSVHTGRRRRRAHRPSRCPPERMQAQTAGDGGGDADAGAWLFSGRLTEPDVATVVRVSAGEVLTTDGPFVESKEHLAGFYIVEADDLDAALGWATRTSAIIGMPIEVRPFWDTRA